MSTTGTFANAIESLKNAAADFSSLTVTTYTGSLKVLLQAGSEDSTINTNDLDFQRILNKALETEVDGDLNVVCFNSHKLDGDAVVFRANGIPEDEMVKLEAAHNAAIQAGQETREGMLSLVKSSVESVFTKAK